jgi:hypothetical protein
MSAASVINRIARAREPAARVLTRLKWANFVDYLVHAEVPQWLNKRPKRKSNHV